MHLGGAISILLTIAKILHFVSLIAYCSPAGVFTVSSPDGNRSGIKNYISDFNGR
tara:strand:+ start:73632 stop:73796 length:165 start_codon:yes stop_codon:yes gene_type:complete